MKLTASDDVTGISPCVIEFESLVSSWGSPSRDRDAHTSVSALSGGI